MNWSNKFTDILKALGATFVLLVSVNACTDVDDRLGSKFLPQNQKMKVRVATLDEGVKTYLYKEDTLVSSRLGYAYFGQEYSNVFGARKNSVLLQFLPTSLPYDEGYGLNPIIDSLFLILPLYAVNGDTTQVQKFDVYNVKGGPDLLHRDSTYYVNFPIEDYITDKLFTFEHTGKRSVGVKLTPTAAGKEYLKDLVDLDMETYKDDTLFLKKYQGLYITPASNSPVNAAVYASNLDAAAMLIFARNHDTIDVSAIYDTVYSSFEFRDTDKTQNGVVTVKWNNVSINMVDFDYTGSTLGALESPEGFIDTFPDSPTQPLMYIQPMSGVTGFMRFTDEFIDYLRDLRNDKDDEGAPHFYPSIMINQAMMFISLEDDSTPLLNSSMKRLGSYKNIKKLAGIPDYLYYYEAYMRSQNNTKDYELPYNGYLNRSNGYYELDITSFVQQLAKGERGDPHTINPVINLGPEAYGFFGFGQSVLKGSGSDDPIKIRLTYMLIDGTEKDE